MTPCTMTSCTRLYISSSFALGLDIWSASFSARTNDFNRMSITCKTIAQMDSLSDKARSCLSNQRPFNPIVVPDCRKLSQALNCNPESFQILNVLLWPSPLPYNIPQLSAGASLPLGFPYLSHQPPPHLPWLPKEASSPPTSCKTHWYGAESSLCSWLPAWVLF